MCLKKFSEKSNDKNNYFIKKHFFSKLSIKHVPTTIFVIY